MWKESLQRAGFLAIVQTTCFMFFAMVTLGIRNFCAYGDGVSVWIQFWHGPVTYSERSCLFIALVATFFCVLKSFSFQQSISEHIQDLQHKRKLRSRITAHEHDLNTTRAMRWQLFFLPDELVSLISDYVCDKRSLFPPLESQQNVDDVQ